MIDTHKLAVSVRTKRGSRTLREAADESGLSISMLSRLEREDGTPDATTLFAICDWLDMPVDYFRIRQHPAAA